MVPIIWCHPFVVSKSIVVNLYIKINLIYIKTNNLL